jgi:NAD(P)-dependent dehydrogenase (short-subunit alcohol dehydrogenase family)
VLDPLQPQSLFKVQGMAAIVTGGASGLGQQMARTLAAHGAAVAVADRNLAGAKSVSASLEAQGLKAIPIEIDVSDLASVQRGTKQLMSHFGQIDIAVNAAGVAGGQVGDENPITIWRHIIDVDLSGVYYCCLAVAEMMRAQRFGTIINIASMSAAIVNHFPQPPVTESRILGLSAYCAAKAGVKQLTKVLASQWAPHGIRVNCISPGYMATEMNREIFEMPEVVRQINAETPLHRIGQPRDLDGAVLYLASDASSFMTGAELLIDGGYTLW